MFLASRSYLKTREAIVPYLVAVSLPQHSYIQYYSHIPQA